MAKMDRCPICDVAVKPENLLRHLNDIHPRHPDVPAIRERIKEEGRPIASMPTGRPIRIRKWHVLAVVAVVFVVIGGVLVAPYIDPNRNFTRDSCVTMEIFHFHPFLRINILGSDYPIPGNIGITAGCHKPIHTHSGYDPSSGFVQLHVEGPVARDFTLGDFFYIWGQPFSSTRILTYADDGTNHVRMTLDGSPSTAYGGLVLRDGQRIEVFYGPTS